ncbi:MAG: hypothetical protein QOC72_3749 [Methylobacteriaceae bacterium]|jgi:hypothetical protein|nr:hypothetical protein [Methylobacteriaceae bacterium]
MIRRLTLIGALAIGVALSGSAYAQQGGGGSGGMDSGLGDARARDLPTAQGVNNGYQNGVYWGSPSGPMVGYNSPPMSYWGSPYGYGPAYGYGYAPGYSYGAGPEPGPVVGRSVYAGPRHKRHHHHW